MYIYIYMYMYIYLYIFIYMLKIVRRSIVSVILYKDFIIISVNFKMRKKKILSVSCLFGFLFIFVCFFNSFILKGECDITDL